MSDISKYNIPNIPTELISFVYAKDGKIIVLDLERAKQVENELKADGWVHTDTLNPCRFLEFLANNSEEQDILIELERLKITNKYSRSN